MNDFIHVFPLKDLRCHRFGDDLQCDCNPWVDWERKYVIHYAFNGNDMIDFLEGKKMMQLPNGQVISIADKFPTMAIEKKR